MSKAMKNKRIAALAIAIAVLTTSTFAQVQQVQQGRALDANPMVGSGGSNQPIPGYVPINGNDIVSGNVAGLKYFHGNVQTVSPYELQVPTAGSSFSNFARQSAGGIPTSPTSVNQSFYLPSNTVSTAQGSLYSSPYGSGYDSRIIPGAAVSPTAAPIDGRAGSWASGGIPLRTFNAAPPSSSSVREPGQAISNPLFGMRQSNPIGRDDVAPQTPDSQQTNPNGQPLGTSQRQTEQQRQKDLNKDLDKPDAKPTDDPSQAAMIDARLKGSDFGRVNGQTQDTKNTLAAGDQWEANQKNQMRLSVTYRDLQAKLDKAKEETTPTNANDATAADAALRSKPPNAEEPRKDAAGNPLLTRTTPLTGSAADAARNPMGMQTQSIDPSKPGYRPRSAITSRSTLLENPLEETPTKTLRAGKKVEPLKSLTAAPAANDTTRFDQLMKQGEGLLKEGKYFDAADVYQSALTQQPDNPLALLGRANAELGAGMYTSSAYDLQLLFTRKPEMVSVRYALEDYIPIERQNFLVKDLNELSTAENTGNAGSFLLCYMCYNTGREDELQAELVRWSARPWRDSWASVLQRAWGK